MREPPEAPGNSGEPHIFYQFGLMESEILTNRQFFFLCGKDHQVTAAVLAKELSVTDKPKTPQLTPTGVPCLILQGNLFFLSTVQGQPGPRNPPLPLSPALPFPRWPRKKLRTITCTAGQVEGGEDQAEEQGGLRGRGEVPRVAEGDTCLGHVGTGVPRVGDPVSCVCCV